VPFWFAQETLDFTNSSLLVKNIEIKIYRSVILPVVLHGCETWSLILSEEHRLREFQNRELGNVFGPKRDKVTGEWRRLHNEELRCICSWTKYWGDQIEKNEMGGAYVTYGRQERCMQGFGGET
jgi:hypothetical protein